MKKNWMVTDNKGVSLVELIVVTAIIVVLAGVGIFLYGLIPHGRVNSVVRKAEAGIEKTRNNAMSFYAAEYVMSRDSGKYYGMTRVSKTLSDTTVDQGNAETLGNGVKVTIWCKGTADDAVETSYVMEDGDWIRLSFDRSSGSFKPMEATLSSTSDGSEVIIGTGENVYLTKIVVSTSGSYSKAITCTKLTGKITVE